MSLRYFKTDSRRFTLTECWHLAPGWLSRLVLLFTRIFRIRLGLGPALPMPELAREFQAAEENVPEAIRAEIAPLLQELEAMGFHSPQYSMAPEHLIRTMQVCTVTLPHRSGEMLAHIAFSKTTVLHPPLKKLFAGFATVLRDSRSIATTAGPRQMDPVPGDEVRYLTGQPLAAVFAEHRRRIEPAIAAAQTRLIRTPEEVWDWTDESHVRLLKERFERGVWVWAEPEPGPAASAATPPPLPGAAVAADDVIFSELERLQQPKRTWGTALLVFGGTLLLFVAAGSWQWNWKYVLMIVPILLFHECGHYVAMRWFGYQHLRMFFVPFFGAAVSGLRLNAPGWQQAVVALAGPLPGILVGGVLMWWAGRMEDGYWLERFGRLCVILNGFNLLPIQPLDGGRVLDALIYARSRWLETGAIAVGALALMVLSAAGMGKVFFILGGFMLIGIPHVWRVGRLSYSLRQKGFAADPPDARAISRPAAESILTEIRSGTAPKVPLPPKALAQIILAVYQRLHTRAAGLLSTLALLLTHAGALALAVFLVFSLLSARWQMDRLMKQLAMPVPTPLEYICGSPLPSAGETPVGTNWLTLAAVFPGVAEAEAATGRGLAFTNMPARLTRVGAAVLLSVPGDLPTNPLPALRGALQPGSTNICIAGDHSNGIVVHVRCELPDTATAGRVEEAISDYLRMPRALKISPPWAGESSGEEQARRAKARATFLALEKTWNAALHDPEVRELTAQTVKSPVRTQEWIRVTQLINTKAAALQREMRGQPERDQAVLEAYLLRPEASPIEKDDGLAAWHLKIGELLGQERGAEGVDNRLALTGVLDRKEREMTLSYVSFEEPALGLPALLRYLCAQGCEVVRFGLGSTDAEDFALE